MSELKHWLDEASDADEFERSILRAGLEADPPQVAQDQIWSNLMGTLAVAPVLAAAAAAGVENASATASTVGIGKASAVWLAVAKGFIVGLSIYGATAAVMEIANRLTVPRVPKASVTRVVTPARVQSGIDQRQMGAPEPALEPTSEDAPSAARAASRGTDNAPAPAPTQREMDLPSVLSFDDESRASAARVSQLQGETRALRRARGELRAGQLAAAFATLESSRRQFSAPELYQEREALMIELLFRSGQRAAAAQRARDFLGRFPESPHAQQVQSLLR